MTYTIEYLAKNPHEPTRPLVTHSERHECRSVKCAGNHARAEMARHGAVSFRLKREVE